MVDLLRSIRSAGGTLPVVGLALTHSWILAPFLSGGVFYVCFHLGFACALLACALRYHLRPWGAPRRDVLPWVAAGLMCVGSLAVCLTEGQVRALEIVCGVVGGVGSAYCFARWFWAFCSLTLKCAVDCTLLAFALSGCIRLALVGLYGLFSPVPLMVVLAALPFLSAGCLGRFLAVDARRAVSDAQRARWARTAVSPWGVAGAGSGAAAAGKARPRGAGVSRNALLAVFAELLVYGLAFGFLRNGISEWSIQTPSMLLGHCLRIVVPLLLLWWLQLREGGRQVSDGLRVAVLAVVAGLLAAVFFTGLAPAVSSAIVLAARSLVSIFIYMRLFDLAHRSGAHPCTVYGLGRGAYELALVAGLTVYQGLQAGGILDFWTPGATYFLVSCVLLVMLNGFATAMRLPFLQPAASDQATSPLDEACGRVGRAYALSDRELEIMRLVCKGHTKKRIAELLGLSEDTIRYHTKSLYRKLDVHSRQELLDVLGIE